jgi:hypothetical protein
MPKVPKINEFYLFLSEKSLVRGNADYLWEVRYNDFDPQF